MPQLPLDINNKDNITRTTVTLISDKYKILEEIAIKKNVSVAWVIREAIDQYLNNRGNNEQN